jgi:site-specific DNA recombinase
MSNRTIIYARVSTEDQLERYGLPTQIRACREYAARNSLTVTAVITDDGISGTILDRPGLEQVRRAARERQVDVVLMLDVDRLSRELAHLLILKPEIERTARLEFVAAKFEDSPSGRMFFGIRGVIGQYERELTRERTMRGRKERARSGLIVGGRVPYGYRYESGRLTEDPAQAPIARRIYAEYDAGQSMRGIAWGLRVSGAPTWKPGGKWGKSSVGRILENETYAGVAYYGTHRREGKLLRLRDAADRIALTVPALVNRDQWERIQARLAANAYVGRPSSTLLLRGVLFCAQCGRKMAGEYSSHNRSYRCTGRDPLKALGDLCRNRAQVEALDCAVWKTLSRTFTDSEFLRQTLQRRQAELHSIQPGQIEELRKRALRLRRKEESAMSLMLDPDLAADRKRIKEEYKAAADERRRLEGELANIEQSSQPEGLEWLDVTVRAIRAFIENVTPEMQQQFVRRLVHRAEWNGEELRMMCFLAPELALSS